MSTAKKTRLIRCRGVFHAPQRSIGRGQGGIAEDAVCSADIAEGTEVGEGETVKVLGLIADRSKLEAAVANGEAAAVPIVGGLYTGILELAVDEVVTGVGGQVEASVSWFANGQEGLQLLALDGGGGTAALVDGVEQCMADADSGASPTIAGVEVVGVELAQPGVVVEVPLNAKILDGFKPQPRGDRCQVARCGEKGNCAHVKRCVEDVAAAGDERSAETWVDEHILCDLPTGPFARPSGTLAEVIGLGARLWVARLEVEPLGKGEAGLVGICGGIRGVDEENVLGLGTDAADISVG